MGMLGKLKNIFSVRCRAKSSQVSFSKIQLAKVPSYPPFQRGFPVVCVDELLETQSDLISRIRIMLGLGEKFDELILPVIERYARFVHLLPASESHHHRKYGGLFRHGLEVGFWSAQFSLGVVFPFEGAPQYKRVHESRWMLTAFLAGLAHDLGKPINDMRITKEAPRDPFSFESELPEDNWSPYKEGIFDWAQRHNIEKYYLYWKPDRVHKVHERLTNIAFLQIVGLEMMDFISEYDDKCVPEIYGTISGISASGILTKLVMRADQASVTKDLQENRLDMDQYAYGIPIERYLFDAIRSLVGSNRWMANDASGKGFVYVIKEGVFIAWKEANYTLCEELSRLDIKGIPRNPDVLADILIDRGYALANEVVSESGEVLKYRYWPLIHKVEKDGLIAQVKAFALRLESPGFIFSDSTAPISDIAFLEKQETAALKIQDKEGIENTQIDDDAFAINAEPENNPDDALGEEAEELPPTLPDVMKQLMMSNPKVEPLEFADVPGGEQIKDNTNEQLAPKKEVETAKGRSDAPSLIDLSDVQGLSAEPESDWDKPLSSCETKADVTGIDELTRAGGFSIQGVNTLNGDAFVMSGQNMDDVTKLTLNLTGSDNDVVAENESPISNDNLNQSIITLKNPSSAHINHAEVKPKGTKKKKKSASRKNKRTTIPELSSGSGVQKTDTKPIPLDELEQSKSVSLNALQASYKHTLQTNKGSATTVDQLLVSYGKAGGVVLRLWHELIEGRAALGTKIDVRDRFYCVCEPAFENDADYADWVKLAKQAGLVNECAKTSDNWDTPAAKLNDDVQLYMSEIIKLIEADTDPLVGNIVSAKSKKAKSGIQVEQDAGQPKQNPKKESINKPNSSHLLKTVPDKTIAKSNASAMSIDAVCEQFIEMIAAGEGSWLSDWQVHDDTCSVDANKSLSLIVQAHSKSLTAIQLKIFFRKYQNPSVQYKSGRIFVKKAS